MEPKERYLLKKDHRLKSRKAIELLFTKGKSFSHFPFRIFWIRSNEGGLKAGFTVGTRNFKKATDRNRIKRLMRECYRLQKSALEQTFLSSENGLQIFFVYTDKLLPEYHSLFSTMKLVLDRLQKLTNEKAK